MIPRTLEAMAGTDHLNEIRKIDPDSLNRPFNI